MQNFIINEMNKVIDILLTIKKDFIKSLKKKTPSFPAYLVFFKYFKNIIKNIILKILVSGLHLIERHQRHRLYFADKNNKVYLICNITNSKTNVISDIDNLSDDDIFHRYFSQYLKNALFTPSVEQIIFLNSIIKNKSTSWSTRKEKLETIISRYTPDTLTSCSIDLVSYVVTTSITSNQNIFEYINSSNNTQGIVFTYSNNTESNIIFTYIPSDTDIFKRVFNLLVVGGGGGPSNIMTAGGGGGITYYPNYPIPPINIPIKFIVGGGGLEAPTISDNGFDGGDSQFDTFISYGGQGGQGGQESYNGGKGGSINSIYGGGGGGGGGDCDSLNIFGGSNINEINVGQSGNTYYGGSSYYNISESNTVNLPFYSTCTSDKNTYVQLLLGGGGSGAPDNSVCSGGCGIGGIITYKERDLSNPPYNPNGSYLSSNCYGGGGSSENSELNNETGVGGNGVVILWWNNE